MTLRSMTLKLCIKKFVFTSSHRRCISGIRFIDLILPPVLLCSVSDSHGCRPFVRLILVLVLSWDTKAATMCEFSKQEFNGKLQSLSSADQAYNHTLTVIIERIPLKFQVECLVFKLFKTCMKISKNTDPPNACESGGHTKEILVSLYKKYLIELREAIKKILQDNKMQSGKEGNHELFLKILDGHGDSSIRVPDSKMLFAREHPSADVCYAALMGLDVVSILRDKAVDSKVFNAIRDALVRHLLDDDLTVVQAVLTI